MENSGDIESVREKVTASSDGLSLSKIIISEAEGVTMKRTVNDAPLNTAEKHSGDTWLDEATIKLRERNCKESTPYLSVYQSHSKLWYENARLRSLQRDLRNQISTLQHETAEIISAATSSSSSLKQSDVTALGAFADKVKMSLSSIQSELKAKSLVDTDRKTRVDLTKKVRDQQKLLADQQEELLVAKKELSIHHDRLAVLENEVAKDKSSLVAVKTELESVRLLVSTAEDKARRLEVENGQLVMRILAEKEKAAEEFNRMVQTADGGWSWILGTFFFYFCSSFSFLFYFSVSFLLAIIS
jgi:DNA repair exonuclease SbcCD ATPase subunit